MQIVQKGPLHGYALALAIEEKFCWKPNQTAVYNSLKSMESENKVTVEEKIEQGRVQKIYSITEQGREFFDETQRKMKKHMMENFSRFFSFMQIVGDIENSEESEAFQQRIQTFFDNMKDISSLTLLLLRKAPKETLAVIEATLTSLNTIAAKNKIQIPDDE
ncbi:MAG: PadR family transcriptional regulator [Candidatus Heimdallarchaeota archaeon]